MPRIDTVLPLMGKLQNLGKYDVAPKRDCQAQHQNFDTKVAMPATDPLQLADQELAECGVISSDS